MKRYLILVVVLAMVCMITIPTAAAGNLYSVKDGWYYNTSDETGILTVRDNKKEFTYDITEIGENFLGLQKEYTGQLRFVDFEPAAFIGDLEGFENALVDLASNPGMKWVFTGDIVLTQDWIEEHDWRWFDDNETGGYGESFMGDDFTFIIFYPVNIDLGGYTWDLSILTGGEVWENEDMVGSAYEWGLGGLKFAPGTADLSKPITISNGTLIVNYLFFNFFDGDEYVTVTINLMDSLITDAEIWIEDFEEYFPVDESYNKDYVFDNHIPLN